jgi:signal transduction histidine kinase
MAEKIAVKTAKKLNDHRRIARRLSGRIISAQIAAFIVIDCMLFLLILLYRVDPAIEASSIVNGSPAAFVVWLKSVPYLDIASFLVLVSVGVIQALLIVGHAIGVRKQVREQLEPLRELRVAADAFSGAAAGAPGVGVSRVSAEALRRMVEALSHVEARDMSTHIAPESVSPELRPLLETIKEMLDRLEAAYAAQTKFVADASHELRTPIAVIQGYSNLLSRWGSEDPETLRESLEAIKSEAEMMKQMINQLLFLARGDSDTLYVDIQSVDLVTIASEVLHEMLMLEEEWFEQDSEGKYVKHEIEARFPEEGGIFIPADPALIKQLTRILTDNCLRYTPPGGSIVISVSADRESGHARIALQDEGQGIPAEVLPIIFNRFVRADEARTRNAGGSGLGLSIARQIVERHGGTIEVFSIEGAGSRFTVILPLLKE